MAEGRFDRGRKRPYQEKKNMEIIEGSSFSRERKRNPRNRPMVDIYFRIYDEDDDGNKKEWWFILTKSSSWEKYIDPGSVPPLPQPITSPVFASLGSKIYASGGFNFIPDTDFIGTMKFGTYLPSNKVFYYDTRRPKEGWIAAAPMNKGRMHHYMLTDADASKIYALGGHDTQHRLESGTKRLFAEEYDAQSDTWKPLAFVGNGIRLPQPIFGHAIVDQGLLGRKILFHSYLSQNMYYLNTSKIDDVDVFDDTFGEYRPTSAFLDGVLYFISHHSMYAFDVSASSLEVKHVDLLNVKKDTLPRRDYGAEYMPSGRLVSLGNGHLALIWISKLEFEFSFTLHCSILEMEKKGDSFVATVLNCSTHTVPGGKVEAFLAVSSPEKDAELRPKTDNSNRQHKRKRNG